jgi:multidrug efflux pump subunit AcrA (membrane-fusion protein)
MLMHSLLATLAVTLAAPPADQATISTSEAVIDSCEIAWIQDLDVPASDGGVLTKVHVKEGAPVTKNEIIGTIDDREAKAVYQVRVLEYEIAKQLADSDVEFRHAKKAADVAKKAYEKFRTINANFEGAVTQIDLMRHQFEWETKILTIEKAVETAASNQLTADSKKAEMDMAHVALERRTLVAPFDGIVARTYLQEGEWVQPGDAVVQLVRVDQLRIGSRLDGSKWSRRDIEGRKVTVEVTLPGGRKVTVNGKIVFVSPVVEVGSILPVVAEVDTPMENGRPLIYAGMRGRMTVHTNQPAAVDVRPAAPAKANRAAAPDKRRAVSKR